MSTHVAADAPTATPVTVEPLVNDYPGIAVSVRRMRQDLDSADRLDNYGSEHPGADVGLRVRVPLPDALQTNTTFTLKIQARFPRVADSWLFNRIPTPKEFAFEDVGGEPRRLEAAPFA